MAPQVIAGSHTLGHGLGMRHHKAEAAVGGGETCQRLGAQNAARFVRLGILEGASVTRRHKRHSLLAAQAAKVVVQVAGVVGIVAYDKHRNLAPRYGTYEHGRR